MKAQSLRWLVIAAVVALGAALYATSVRQPVADAGIGLKLYPDLEAQLNDVTAVRIYGAGDKQVVGIEKAAAGWTVAERAGYPADVGRVRELLLALAKAKTIEQKTAIATKLPALGLEDLTAPAATGKRLELTGTPQPVSLIVGKSPDDHSSFVRRAGEAQSWQVDVALHAEERPAALGAVESARGAADARAGSRDAADGRPGLVGRQGRGDGGRVHGQRPAEGPRVAGSHGSERARVVAGRARRR